jgi:hypothetical protein
MQRSNVAVVVAETGCLLEAFNVVLVSALLVMSMFGIALVVSCEL